MPALALPLLLLALAAHPAPDGDPSALAPGERAVVTLQAGGAHSLVVVPDRPGPLTVDAQVAIAGVSLRATDSETVVLAVYRDAPAARYVRVVVEAEQDVGFELEVASEADVPSEVDLTARAGVFPLAVGDATARADSLRELGEALEQREWLRDAVMALHFAGEIEYREDLYRRCDRTYARVLELARLVGRRDLVAIAHVRLGSVRLAFDEPLEALEELGPALEQAVALGHRPLELVARICTGQALRQLGNLEAAEEMFASALELARATNDAATVSEAQRELGRVAWLSGRRAEADAWFREATEGARATQRPGGVATALLFEAVFRKQAGELGRARELLEEALAMETSAALRAQVLGELANVEKACGNQFVALALYTRVLDLSRELGALKLERTALLNLGIVNLRLGEWRRAQDNLTEAIALLDGGAQPIQRAEALRALGNVYLATDRVADAVPLVEGALILSEGHGEPGVLARALASRVDCLVRLDRLEDALAPARRLSALGHEQGIRVFEAVGLDLEAEVRLRQGDWAGARTLSDRALPLLRAAEDRWLLQWALLTAVDLAIRTGNGDAALRLVAEAEECFASTDLALADPERLASRRATDVFAKWGEHSQDAAALALAAPDLAAERRAALVAEGFRRAGFWKARSLLRGITDHRRGARSAATMALRRDLGDARAEEERLLESIADALREGADPRVRSLRAALGETRARAAELERRWREASPRDAALDLPDGVAPERLARLLAPGDVLVEYAAGVERLYAYALVDGRLAFRDLGDRASLEGEVEAFLAGIASPSRLAPPAEVARGGRRLFDALLAPLLPAGSSARLIVVPTPALAALPFEALVEEAADEVASFADVTFVLDRREVGYASSTSVLALLAEVGPRTEPGPALVLADPLYASESGAVARGAHEAWQRLEGTRAEALAVATALLAADEDGDGLRERFARERSFSASSPDLELRLGSEAATEALSGDLRRYAILHCASHGRVDPDDPRQSGLVLTPSATDDGLLTIADILELDLDADLAVLSACETGRGAVQRGEGVQSLARAFLYAGARAVVSSLWPVDDQETQAIMARFYEERAVRGATELSALRAARLAVRRGAGTAGSFRGVGRGLTPAGVEGADDTRSTTPGVDRVGHPFFWASFVYVGRPR